MSQEEWLSRPVPNQPRPFDYRNYPGCTLGIMRCFGCGEIVEAIIRFHPPKACPMCGCSEIETIIVRKIWVQ